MAGYQRDSASGDRFINATAINTQMESQRTALTLKNPAGRPLLGVGNNTESLFNYERLEDSPSAGDSIMTMSVNTMNELYNNGYIHTDLERGIAIANPDFASASLPMTFSENNNINAPIDDDIADKPGIKGPNLKTPDVNTLSTENIRENVGSENLRGRGYGWSDIDSAERGIGNNTIGQYFSQKYNRTGENPNKTAVIKGESDPTNSGLGSLNSEIDYDQ